MVRTPCTLPLDPPLQAVSNARSGAHTKETWTAETFQKLSGRPTGCSL